MQSTVKLTFKVLYSNRKCAAAVKCLSLQNGRIKFDSVWAILGYFVQMKQKMHTTIFTQATNEFQNLEKCDILKNA